MIEITMKGLFPVTFNNPNPQPFTIEYRPAKLQTDGIDAVQFGFIDRNPIVVQVSSMPFLIRAFQQITKDALLAGEKK